MNQDHLTEYKWLLISIQQLENEIARMRDTIDLKSQRFDGMPKSNNVQDKLCEIISMIADAEMEHFDKLATLFKKRAEIERAIELLPEKEKAIIRMRYIEGLAWDQISYNSNYSKSQIKRIIRNGMDILKDDPK